ncbi:MAG: hypothetical protein LBP33_12640 [Candidatus Adiutrix sp.]|jgi:hypothetical protein|nr:hypothetical protein [Candidatus Adiutrix sp.]
MKIFQFAPNPLLKTRPAAGSEAAAPDFASVLKQAADKAQAPSAGPGRAVFQENVRALQLPSPSELRLAGRLINQRIL